MQVKVKDVERSNHIQSNGSGLGLYVVVHYAFKNTFLICSSCHEPSRCSTSTVFFLCSPRIQKITIGLGENGTISWHEHKLTKLCKALNCLAQLLRACVASLHSYDMRWRHWHKAPLMHCWGKLSDLEVFTTSRSPTVGSASPHSPA